MRTFATWSTAAFALALALASVISPPEAVRAQGLGESLRRRTVKDLAAGKLLIAARKLTDPNFASTVVLLADFSKDGAMGLVVNRPTKIVLSRLFPQFESARGGATTAFFGGPVLAPGVVVLLRSTGGHSDSRRIVGDVYLSTTLKVLDEMISAGAESNRFRVYVGYSGWGAGQLEAETAEGAWHVVDGDADVVFDPDSRATWERQIRRTEALSATRDGAAEAPPSLRASGYRLRATGHAGT